VQANVSGANVKLA